MKSLEERKAARVKARQQAREDASQDLSPVRTDQDAGSMTVKQLTEKLTERGVEIPKGSNKATLVELYENSNRAATDAANTGSADGQPFVPAPTIGGQQPDNGAANPWANQ